MLAADRRGGLMACGRAMIRFDHRFALLEHDTDQGSAHDLARLRVRNVSRLVS